MPRGDTYIPAHTVGVGAQSVINYKELNDWERDEELIDDHLFKDRELQGLESRPESARDRQPLSCSSNLMLH